MQSINKIRLWISGRILQKDLLRRTRFSYFCWECAPLWESPHQPLMDWEWDLATTFVLVMANIVVSLIKSQIPDKVRIPSFIVIIATFVTVVELMMEAYLPACLKAWAFSFHLL
jgi:hypothetical protein